MTPSTDVSANVTTWGLLRTAPAFAWFMAGLVPGAVVIGIAAVTRTVVATDVFGNETGIATTAIASGLAAAAAGLLMGTLVDRWNARWILITSMAGIGIGQALTFVVHLVGGLTIPTMTALAIVEGFFIGIQITALLTTQAGLVPQGGRGAAEITNALRIGIGSIIGTLLATAILPLAVSLAISAVITLLVAGITVWTSRGFQPVRSAARVGLKTVIATATRPGRLRSIVIIDAVFALLLPTQLVNLVIVDKDLPDLLGIAVASGFLGVLAARIHLASTGLRGSLVRRVALSYVTFLVILPISWLVLFVESKTVLVFTTGPLIFLGSWAATLTAGLVSATVQEELPDEMRGRFTGALNAVRSLAAAGGVLLASAIITPQNTETFLAVLFAALIIVLVLSRGFAGLRIQPIRD